MNIKKFVKVSLKIYLGAVVLAIWSVAVFLVGSTWANFESLEDGAFRTSEDLTLNRSGEALTLPAGVMVYAIDVPSHQQYYALIFKGTDIPVRKTSENKGQALDAYLAAMK